MNRFRRKSESRSRRKDVSSSGAEEAPTTPATLLLPEASNFRTSLILPHLTKRFSLLRDSEGRLVDLNVLQSHLAAQRKTGMLTETEADAVLAQFAIERQQQPTSPPVPRINRPPRRDWSQEPTVDGDEADESARESYLSTSTADHTSSSFRSELTPSPGADGGGFQSSTFGRSSNFSSIPFPHSPDSTNTSGSFSPPLGATHPYKRGGNSMFGGRVQTMQQMKMSKSTASIVSANGSLKRSGSDRTIADEEGGSSPTTEEPSPAPSVREKEEAKEEESTAEDTVEEATDSAPEPSQRFSAVPSLSEHQLKRISRALDGIELDLSKTFARIGLDTTPESTADLSEVARPFPTSPTSDTDAMDPHFHRLAPSVHSRSPSMASSFVSVAGSASPSNLASPPKPDYPAPSPPPSVALPRVPYPPPPIVDEEELAGEGGADVAEQMQDVEDEEEEPSVEEPPTPTSASLGADAIPSNTVAPPILLPLVSPPLTLPYLDTAPATPRETRSRQVSNASTENTLSPLSPSSASLSLTTPSKGEADQSFSDHDGPFDLSFGSKAGHAESWDEEDQLEVVEDGSTPSSGSVASPFKHQRFSSMDSTGSSYHAAAEEPSTDAEDLFRSPGARTSTSTNPNSSPPLVSSLQIISSPPTTDAGAEAADAFTSHDDEHLRVSAESMSRRPSNELLETINSSSPTLGEADLALEDLLMIQETLVRSASRRAAAKKALTASPTSPSQEMDLSGLGVRRSSENGGAGEWLRKGSLEGSGSDGRRGSESDARSAGRRGSESGNEGRRGSSEGGWRTSSGAAMAEGRRGSGEPKIGSGRRRSSGLESGLSPYRTSRATGTSATGSSPMTNGAPTPSSTTQSDAFEFSSLVGSPDSGSWHEHKELLASPRQPEEISPLVNGASPRSDFSSPGPPSTFHSPNSQLAPSEEEPEQEEPNDEVKRLAEATDIVPLGEPTKLDADSFLRVPRKPMVPRDPSNTQSMLIRDVRNQATLATIALKKAGPAKNSTSPVIGRSKSLSKSKSIRKTSISSPQLVSGTSDIPAVPILNPDIPPSPLMMSPKSPGGKASGSARQKRGDDGDGSKSRGIGMRFKNLLNKKQSRDKLSHLNGDEITPFVDDSPDMSPPFTPSQQASSTLDHTHTSEAAPAERRPSIDHLRARSPAGLPVVAESPEVDHGSPSTNSTSSGNSNNRSLGRLLSRVRGAPNRPRRESESTLAAGQDHRSVGSTPEPSSIGGSPLARTYSPEGAARRPSIEQQQETFGLGIHTDTSSSRAPISYDIGARRARIGSESSSSAGHDYAGPVTAPLAVGLPPQRQNAPEPPNLQHFSFPAATSSSSVPASQRPAPGIRHRHTDSGTSIASVDSMRKLWEAAEDLGLPRDKVEELVNLSYAQSPTTSHAHSGSTSSTLGRRSQDGGDTTTRQRKPSVGSQSARGHRRGVSNASAKSSGRPRANSATSTSRSIHDRVPTPPPSMREHRRQASNELRAAEAESVPELPQGLRVETAQVGSLRPPLSPSADSYRSSGYAGSVFDLYGGSEDSEGERRFSQDDEGVSEVDYDEEGVVVLAPGSLPPDTPGVEEQADGSLLWRVVDDLRRTSTASRESDSFGFDSRPSSIQSTDVPDPLAQLLRHHRRNRSSASIPAPSPRYPSIYVRDEKRLVELGREGGVAAGEEEEGHFLVRPRDDPVALEGQGGDEGESEEEGEVEERRWRRGGAGEVGAEVESTR